MSELKSINFFTINNNAYYNVLNIIDDVQYRTLYFQYIETFVNNDNKPDILNSSLLYKKMRDRLKEVIGNFDIEKISIKEDKLYFSLKNGIKHEMQYDVFKSILRGNIPIDKVTFELKSDDLLLMQVNNEKQFSIEGIVFYLIYKNIQA